MLNQKIIKKYYNMANQVSLYLMYFNKYIYYNNLKESDLKNISAGHLGSSLSINFILSNLFYFLNQQKLNSKLIIGTGHSGLSLITNLWLNSTLTKYYPKYSLDINGFNNLINDFGKKIRTEINPQYPETIFDGGELGYSLGVAYGYALTTNNAIVPCIIGDGEAETGTLCSSWQLNKILKCKSKVLPIINLNGYKMNSTSILSRFTDEQLLSYFQVYGYKVHIIDARNNNVDQAILDFQRILHLSILEKSPLIIFKSYKGYTLPSVNNVNYQNLLAVHKNPLANINSKEKLKILKEFLKVYNSPLFSNDGDINKIIDYFKISSINNEIAINNMNVLLNDKNQNNFVGTYLKSLLINNHSLVFSPDEIGSNRLNILKDYTIELLNENILQSLYQGYIQSGKNGFYIAYEGFMPIIASMVEQYYKYLLQKSVLSFSKDLYSLNYILTSTCWENTYSHQNPSFGDNLMFKNDKYCNVYFPKDKNNLLKCINYVFNTKNKINVITVSKRHDKIYQTYEDANIRIEVLEQENNPNIILVATGDYMLDFAYSIYEKLKLMNINTKLIYLTKPKILDMYSNDSLSEDEFIRYFDKDVPVLYFYAGLPDIIKSMLYNRNVNFKIFGYENELSNFGSLENNLLANGFDEEKMVNLCLNLRKGRKN